MYKRTPAQYELTQANAWLPMSPPGQTLEPDVLAAARPQKVNSSSCGKKIKYASIFKKKKKTHKASILYHRKQKSRSE